MNWIFSRRVVLLKLPIRIRGRFARVTLVAGCLTGWLPCHVLLLAQTNASFQYFYDDLGQLTKVLDSTGNVVEYIYDPVGNILQIRRSSVAVGGLAVFNFTPQRGGPGLNVTIQGQGFSSTAAANGVQFNGTPATVLSSSATSLVATVPAGATTGPISVTVSGQTATSTTNFTVPPAPVLSPANASITQGATQQFTASVTLPNRSTQDVTTSVTWASSNTGVATVSNLPGTQGLVTGTGTGTTVVSADTGFITGSTGLTVTPPALVSIGITPANPLVLVGKTEQLTATGTFSNGSTQDFTRSAVWNSSNPAVATVSSSPGTQGLATAVGIGTSMVSASSGGITGSTTLRVFSASLSDVPASIIVGPAICKPGFSPPQCTAVPFDTSHDLAYQGNGFARPAVAFDVIPGFNAIHRPEYANDGFYGNGASWISNSPNSWLKVDLGRAVMIDRVTFGRDRTGGFDDRDPGQFTIAVALTDNTYGNGADTDDAKEYTVIVDSQFLGFSGDILGPETLQVSFTPVLARFVKMTFANAGTAIDELEIPAPDPGTTVAGRVVDGFGLPISGATVTTSAGAHTATTAADGSYTIPGVPTISGNIQVSATFNAGGITETGVSAATPPVPSGTTEMADIVVGDCGTYCTAVLSDHPVGYWRLNESSKPTAFDSSGNGNNASYNGGVTLGTPGPLSTGETAATFDGSQGFVSVGGTWGGPTFPAVTIEAWVFVNATSPDFEAIASSTNLSFVHLQLNSGGNIAVFTNITGSSWLSLPIVPQTPIGSWHHIAVVSESGNSRVYVDGAQFGGSLSNTFSFITAATGIRIGSGFNNGRFMNGQIGEVAIYNHALPASRIQVHFAAR
jgi:YD repeat-containing protein